MDSVSPLSPPVAGFAGAGDLCGGDEAAARTGRHLRMLEELAGIGMRLARDVERRALADEPPRDALPDPALIQRAGTEGAGADFGLMFARIARAVRQTVALEARLAADAQARVTAGATAGAAAQASRAAAERKRGRQLKDKVRRLAEAAIETEASGHVAENLRYDLDERLEDPDFEAELGWRPIGVIFAAICQDLGITPDLSHFTDAELGFDMAAKRAGRGAAANGGPAAAALDRDADRDGTASAEGRDEAGQEGFADPRGRHGGDFTDPTADPAGDADTGDPP